VAVLKYNSILIYFLVKSLDRALFQILLGKRFRNTAQTRYRTVSTEHKAISIAGLFPATSIRIFSIPNQRSGNRIPYGRRTIQSAERTIEQIIHPVPKATPDF